MRAAVCTGYGPPETVKIMEVPDPVCGDDDVLVRVAATTVNSGDTRIRALRVPRGLAIPTRLSMGILRPRNPVFGFDAAGRIEKIGRNVEGFKIGDRVLASRGFKFGAHAELLSVPTRGVSVIVRIPGRLSDEDAVALPFGGVTALVFLGEGKLKPGEHILINGASGAVGTMTIQIAKHRGAEITAVCSAGNAALVKSLGADHVIDYRATDFTQGATRYDLIMDTVGNASYDRVKHLLKPGGRFLMVIGNAWEMLTGGRRPDVVGADQESKAFTTANYQHLLDLAERGVLRAVIDSVYPFEDIATAHARVDTGHKVGSVVVTLGTRREAQAA